MVQEKGCDFLALPHPPASRVNLALEVNQLLQVGQRTGHAQFQSIEGVVVDDGLISLRLAAVEEVEHPHLVLLDDLAGLDDVPQLGPVGLGFGGSLLFLLLHKAFIRPADLLGCQYYCSLMMNISSHQSMACPWKISDNSRSERENSMGSSQFMLANRFTPSKGKSPHRFLSGVLGDRSKSREGKLDFSRGLSGAMKSPRESVGLNRFATLNSMDGSPLPKQITSLVGRKQTTSKASNLRDESNRILLQKLKGEFDRFREEVRKELSSQKNLLHQIKSDILNKVLEVQQGTPNPQRKTVKSIEESVKILTKVEMSPEAVKRTGQQLERFQTKLSEAENQFSQSPIQVATPHFQPPQVATPSLRTTPQQSPMVERIHEEGVVKQDLKIVESQTVQAKEAMHLPPMQHKADNLCDQIVETIGILNQINESPAAPKATEDQYKHKLQQRHKHSQQVDTPPKITQITKIEGGSQLDRFESAIQKLREEVNEIRSKSYMRTAI